MVHGCSANQQAPELTAAVEDYLKVIFELGAGGAVAGTNEIAGVGARVCIQRVGRLTRSIGAALAKQNLVGA